MSDTVSLSFPARGEHLILARLVASALASRAGMDVEEIDDLRLAVDELCLSVMTGAPDAEITLRLTQEGGAVAIDCTARLVESAAGDGHHEPDTVDELSARILEALVDDHGRAVDGSVRSAWLRKAAAR